VARRILPLAALALFAAGCGGAAAKPPAAVKPRHPTLRRIGSLPQAISKAAAVPLPGGRMMILGGLVDNTSIDTILAGPPTRLGVIGHLPQPTHDAAATSGAAVHLFGGGSTVSTTDVVRIDPATGATVVQPPLGEPLSDLGAVEIGSYGYLVGGFTGTEFATAILRYSFRDGSMAVVTRLPHGIRYAGVTLLRRTIYVVGGVTTAGPTRDIFAVRGHNVTLLAKLPRPEAHAGVTALGSTLYYVGGRKILAINLNSLKIRVAATLPVSLSDPSVVTVGNEIVIAGGGTNDVWSFTPAR
jgi:hypothetical protein